MGYADYFDRQVHNGYTGPGQKPYAQQFDQTSPVSNSVITLDANIDNIWANGYKTTKAPNSYFDYYFAGQDIQVTMDGVEDDPDFADIPIIQMGFRVEQQKTPLYGFWSYTYDAVMRGTRLVSGTFVIATRSPDYMKRLLSKAAEARAAHQQTYYYHRGLTEDDANIEKYWGKNLDPAVSDAAKNIFSVHPPFSLAILYGVQNLSISPTPAGYNFEELWEKYQQDNPLALDINERLVESDPMTQSNRIILDGCELVNVETGYAPDGSVVAETYQFFARDYLTVGQKWQGSGSSHPF